MVLVWKLETCLCRKQVKKKQHVNKLREIFENEMSSKSKSILNKWLIDLDIEEI